MREHPVVFNEGITRGLRPYAKMPRNYQSLTDAVNFRVTKRGPEVPPTIVTPDNWISEETGYPMDWPYLRVYRTGHIYFIASDTAICTIFPDTLNLYYEIASDLSPKGFWAMADFGDFAMFCDGSNTAIYYLRSTGSEGSEWYSYTGTFDYLGPRALCNFRQQLTLGGTGGPPATTYLSNWDWAPGIHPWRNVVFWGPVGSIVEDDSLLDGYITSPLERIHVYINDMMGHKVPGHGREHPEYTAPFYSSSVSGWGFAPMHYNGFVWHLKPTHHGLVAYGSNGIGALIPHADPTPTFGYKKIADFGIVGPAAVAGDEDHHIFMDEFGDLWILKSDFSIQKLGYSEFLIPLMVDQYGGGAGGYKIAISHDTLLNDFYISNGLSTYLLSPDGLSEIQLWHPTSLFREKGVLYGPTIAGSSSGASLASDTLDLGIRGIKLVSTMEIGADATDLEAGVDYRYASGNVYASGIWKPANRLGIVTPIVGGSEFKVKLRNASYTSFNPDYVNIRWKAVDKRAIRGPYEAMHGKTIS